MRKRVLVTGGARGIGRAVVEELSSHGYEVIATHYKTTPVAQQNVTYYRVNLRDKKQINDFLNEVNSDPLDVLINNAGLWLGKSFEKTSEDELFEQVELNFAAPARLMQGLLPALKKSKAPMIINMSSQAAHPVYPGEAMYSAAKAALSTLSQVLRMELSPKGVRVITVEPWGVNTYGIAEPSGLVLPEELAQTIRYVIEAPEHLMIEKVGISHIKQWRGKYPDWIEK